MQQQAAIMAAAGGYVPMAAALAAQLPAQVQMANGLASPAITPTSGLFISCSLILHKLRANLKLIVCTTNQSFHFLFV